VLKRAVYALADSPRFTGWLSRNGMRWGMAQRFIAGEAIDEAWPAIQELRDGGMTVTLDYLGEAVHDVEATEVATGTYCAIIDELGQHDNIASVSLKPTQLGLAIDADLATKNIGRIVARAAELGNFVRIDMEDSPTTGTTLDVFTRLRAEHENVGVVVQSYLHRTEADVARLNAIGARLRLCKGAYKEPASVAFQSKKDVDDNYVKLAELLLQEGTYPAFATHDDRIIDHIIDYAERHAIPRDRFEFQMLYGVRRDYQRQIAADDFNIRIYVPFGAEWCPYFMRRIAERPANALFVVRALVGG
jgi:proline dehydrogenase